MFGNWYHWNSYLNVHDHQHPSFPQGEVEGAVGVGPLCGSAPEESDYHGIAGSGGLLGSRRRRVGRGTDDPKELWEG